jgi:hypothetical protein
MYIGLLGCRDDARHRPGWAGRSPYAALGPGYLGAATGPPVGTGAP